MNINLFKMQLKTFKKEWDYPIVSSALNDSPVLIPRVSANVRFYFCEGIVKRAMV